MRPLDYQGMVGGRGDHVAPPAPKAWRAAFSGALWGWPMGLPREGSPPLGPPLLSVPLGEGGAEGAGLDEGGSCWSPLLPGALLTLPPLLLPPPPPRLV